jgi:hypothetical protein
VARAAARNQEIMNLFGEQFARGVLRNPIASIVDGIIGGHAASTAAGVQNNAAQNNAQQINATAAAVNPNITGAATTAGTGVTSAAGTAASNAGSAAQYAQGGVAPYSTAGATAAGQLNQIAANGNQQPTLAQLQISPAYQFQLQQGLEALNRSAAAQGGALSGGDIKSADMFAQGLAGTAYQNAFTDFETAQQNNVANLTSIANAGQNAAQYAGSTGLQASEYGGTANMNAAQYAGTAGINAADLTSANTINAQNTASQYQQVGANDVAAGVMGKAAAYTGAITGATNGITSLATGGLSNLFTNPATIPGSTSVPLGTEDT